MSRIITSLKCAHCQSERKNLYISFGHPEHDFDWEWTCQKCGNQNVEKIAALPCVKWIDFRKMNLSKDFLENYKSELTALFAKGEE